MTVSRPRGRAPCHCPSGPVLRSRSRSVHCANPPDPSTQSIPPSLRLRMERPAPPLARVPCLECTCVCGHAPLDCLAAATGPRPVFPDLLAAATTPDLELYKMSTRSWARPSMSGVVTIMNRMVVDCAGQHRSLPLPILRLKSGVADKVRRESLVLDRHGLHPQSQQGSSVRSLGFAANSGGVEAV